MVSVSGWSPTTAGACAIGYNLRSIHRVLFRLHGESSSTRQHTHTINNIHTHLLGHTNSTYMRSTKSIPQPFFTIQTWRELDAWCCYCWPLSPACLDLCVANHLSIQPPTGSTLQSGVLKIDRPHKHSFTLWQLEFNDEINDHSFIHAAAWRSSAAAPLLLSTQKYNSKSIRR